MQQFRNSKKIPIVSESKRQASSKPYSKTVNIVANYFKF